MSVASDFRRDLRMIMPGYKWTVHPSSNPSIVRATGIMSSGFNRLSTLQVTREESAHFGVVYAVCSAGHGTRAMFGQVFREKSIRRALRDLQDHYLRTAHTYHQLAARLQEGRLATEKTPGVADA